jgi:hypothetical protein
MTLEARYDGHADWYDNFGIRARKSEPAQQRTVRW